MTDSQQILPGATPAQIDPAEFARLEALPSGEIDVPRLIEHMDNGGVAADAAAEVQAAKVEVWGIPPRLLYPVGTTAVWKKIVSVVTIIEAEGDRRRVQWKRGDDKYSNREWVSVDELSQSDDPATVETLAAKSFAQGKWAIYGKETYVKILEVNGRERKITYIDDLHSADPFAEHWVDVRELKPVLFQEGQMGLYLGQVARVEEVEEDRRKITYLKETETWVNNYELKPLASDDHAGLEIAQLEINLAKQRDDAAAKIAELEERLADQTREYDAKLKAQLDISNGLQRELDSVRGRWAEDIASRGEQVRTYMAENERLREQNSAMAAADPDEIGYLENLFMHGMAELKARIKALESQTCDDVDIEIYSQAVGSEERQVQLCKTLKEFKRQGWKIVFEEYSGGTSNTSATYFARLERPAQKADYTPMEVEVVQPAVSDEAPEPTPQPEADEVVTPPQTALVVGKQRPVLPAPKKDPLHHTRQIHQDIERWKAEQNTQVLAAGTAAYQARLNQHGRDDDDDDDRLNFTRPRPFSPFSPRSPMTIIMQVPS